MCMEGGGHWVQVNPFVHKLSNGTPTLVPLLLSISFKNIKTYSPHRKSRPVISGSTIKDPHSWEMNRSQLSML